MNVHDMKKSLREHLNGYVQSMDADELRAAIAPGTDQPSEAEWVRMARAANEVCNELLRLPKGTP